MAISSNVVAAAQREVRRRGRVSTHAQTSTIAARGVTQVQLRLARGSVRVVGTTTGGEITMHVSQRSTSTDARTVVPRVVNSSSGIRIVAVHPPPFPGIMHDCLQFDEELGDFWHYDVTVDVELLIPSNFGVHVRTMRGEVVVSGINGSVDVATNDGTIHLRTLSGDIAAAALGNVDLELDGTSSPRSQAIKLSAYTGDITVHTPFGQAISTDDGQAVAAVRESTELIRVDGSATRQISMSLGEMHSPLSLTITRGRLMVVPIRTLKPQR